VELVVVVAVVARAGTAQVQFHGPLEEEVATISAGQMEAAVDL
tara:strand:- start:601 stop:729 length:129 start_codon:yes stop_codon:yes gene_type:complete